MPLHAQTVRSLGKHLWRRLRELQVESPQDPGLRPWVQI